MRRRNLLWGKSPWDKITREDLLHEVRKGYAAVSSARRALAILSQRSEVQANWRESGTCGQAMAKCGKVIDAVERKNSSESIFHRLFRYAATLLFEESNRWAICALCDKAAMEIDGEEIASMIGNPCQQVFVFSSNECAGTMRWFGWCDFKEPRELAHAN